MRVRTNTTRAQRVLKTSTFLDEKKRRLCARIELTVFIFRERQVKLKNNKSANAASPVFVHSRKTVVRFMADYRIDTGDVFTSITDTTYNV